MGAFLLILMVTWFMSSTYASSENNVMSRSIMTSYWNDFVTSNILPHLKAAVTSGKLNLTLCLEQLEKIFDEGGDIRDIILDATGKPASGLLEGNLAWLGNYRQCIEKTDLHYCLIKQHIRISDVSSRMSGNLILGVCLPEVCTENQILPVVRVIGDLFLHVEGRVTVDCSDSDDSDRADPLRDAGFICTLIFILLLVTLCICATTYDSYLQHRSLSKEEKKPLIPPSDTSCNSPRKVEREDLSSPAKTLVCFSLTRSINQITNTTPAKDDIRCLHGMRVISMFWIILGHSFSYQQGSGAMAEILWVYTIPAKWFTSQVIYNAYSALDTFFFLGGLLMAYTGFKYMSKSVGRVNWLLAIVHRYLRITPAMGVMILLYTFVYPYLGDGPFWNQRVDECHRCYEWWWTNFLYINNFVPENVSGGCLSWTWYLATDMQLFLVAIILIILLWWYPKLGIVALILLSLACLAVRATIYSIRDYAATEVLNQSNGDMHIFNVKPYACAPAYLLGVAIGYILHISKNKPVRRLHWLIVIAGWLISFAVGMSVVYGLYGSFTHPGPKVVAPSKVVNVLYSSLKGFVWSLALAWVVFSCHSGYGGVINQFLSWSFWIPLSRLTFCAYLLHPATIYLYTGTLSMLVSPSIISQSFIFAGFVTISYSAAFILSALVEMPICSLQKMLLKR